MVHYFVFIRHSAISIILSILSGYYYEWVSPQEQGRLKLLAGKAVCKKCHAKCKKCTGYGFHEQVCQECMKYKRGEQCEDECPVDHFTDTETQLCIPCYSECRGCSGPGSNHCHKCRNYKIYIVSINTMNHLESKCTFLL